MRKATAIIPFILLIAFLAIIMATEPRSEAEEGSEIWTTSTNGDAKPFAVVQLFTSEGCSSCPPADRLLTEIWKDAEKDKKPIYPLAFHVDYWDRLGWKDPYSQPEFTAIQRDYAEEFRLSQIYTPQMIVNGYEGFVGSNKRKAEEQIGKALRTGSAYQIGLIANVNSDEPNIATVTWTIRPLSGFLPEYLTLCIAAAENDLKSEVTAGENKGKDLEHNNIVRTYETLTITQEDLTSSTPIVVKVKSDSELKNVYIVAYLQDPDSLGVIGASRIPWPLPGAENFSRASKSKMNAEKDTERSQHNRPSKRFK